MKKVMIVRDRGQITIPDNIRKTVSWITPMSAVSISVVSPDEIVIKPHQKHVDWDKIWKNIHASRAISGKGKGEMNATKFLESDRNSH